MLPAGGLSLTGIALAAAFAVGLGSVLWWMLHVPSPMTQEVARAVHSVRAVRRIMVPIMDRFYSERAVELACRLGAGRTTKILLAYVIEVPRTMPLDIALPHVERRAEQAIEDGLSIVKRHGLIGETTVLRAREAGGGIARAARDYDMDMLILGVRGDQGLLENIFARTTALLLRRAPCEVIIDHVPVGTLPVEEPAPTDVEVSQ
jgi:nucleotide-binding universal stress UspA family protein